MAYSDRKVRKSRARNWTQADERRMRAQQRRETKVRAAEKAERDAILGAMSEQERIDFLAAEEVEIQRKETERQERHEEYTQKLRVRQNELVADSRLMAGFLQTEIAAAISYKEVHGRHDGDWLDNPVAALTGQGGFGEEVSKNVGIKLQIHLCLDTSNSMYHNGIGPVATETLRTMYLALDQASKELPSGSLTVHLWKWAIGDDGKGTNHLTHREHSYAVVNGDDDPRGITVYLPGRWLGDWTGEDTWIHPLLERLEEWEQLEGDPGAYRLDIIISDGMLEHPTDARKGDVIQERRAATGNLQSIVLNFLPMSDWGDFRVPNRMVQYPATAENLMGLMRSILGQWLVGI